MVRATKYAWGIALTGVAVASMAWAALPPGAGFSAKVATQTNAALSDVVGWFRRGPVDGRQDWEEAARTIFQGDASRGAGLMIEYGCGSCHTIPGVVGASGSVGPHLDGFAKRAYVGGVLPNEPNGLVRWLINPPLHSPQTAMPDLGVSEAEARDMAAYLYTLRGG